MKDILKKISNLPDSWDQLLFKDYLILLSLTDIPSSDNDIDEALNALDRNMSIISALTSVSVEQLENLPFNHIQAASSKLSFLVTEVPNVKIKHKIKSVDEVIFKDYVKYFQLTTNNKTMDHLQYILPMYYHDITEDDVLQMPAAYVLNAFFLLKKYRKRYVNYSIFRTYLRTIFLMLKEKLILIRKKLTRKRNS